MDDTYELTLSVRNRRFRRWLLLLCLLAANGGCRAIHPGRCTARSHLPNVPDIVPREQSKVTLPDYLIEPPDILKIDAVNLVPKSPYRLKAFDVLAIYCTGVDDEENITGEYTLQADGVIPLGHSYGVVPALGMTREEVEAEILDRLKARHQDPKVWVTLSSIGSQQQITGEHLVAPDGKVNLGSYGRVRVVGMSIEEARKAVETHLSQHLENPEISLDVLGYNSKVYYVITQGAGLGDQVYILPARGNETVLDAIGQIQGLQGTSSTRMWLARPGYNEAGGDQILPVDWLAVTQCGDIATNYQVMPGDRLYVSEDKLVAFDTAFAKFIAPVERILGVTLLGTDTAQRIKFFNRPIGLGFGGGGITP